MPIHVSFYNATAATVISTLSLHDALPIWTERAGNLCLRVASTPTFEERTVFRSSWFTSSSAEDGSLLDRKSTRLNSSHVAISYAVFCLKKKRFHRSRELALLQI